MAEDHEAGTGLDLHRSEKTPVPPDPEAADEMDAARPIPYCGVGPTPAEWLSRWNLDSALIILLVAAALLLALRSGRVRNFGLPAVAVLAIVFVSPLCALASALFAARTLHHLLLIAIAAPLIAAALPPMRRTSLALAAATHAMVFVAWHAPEAYDAALASTPIYWAMQISLLGTAGWFWSAIRVASAPAAVAGLLGVMVIMGLVGAVLVFAPTALYAPHAFTTTTWDLTPLADQQAAGLLMWIPGGGLYLAAALAILTRLLAETRPRAAAA